MNPVHFGLFIYELLRTPFFAAAATISGFSIAAAIVVMILEVIPQGRR